MRAFKTSAVVTIALFLTAACSAPTDDETADRDEQAQAIEQQAGGAEERPAFNVLASVDNPGKDFDAIELRRYAPMILAQVPVEASNAEEASEKGFEPLADFIFGNNDPRTEMAMTTPVTTSRTAADGGEQIRMTAPVTAAREDARPGEEIGMTAPVTTIAGDGANRYTVSFFMPPRYTMETLPRPVNQAVLIEQVPARRVAAIRLTGERSEARLAAAERALRRFIEQRGLRSAGPIATASFDAPMVPVTEREWELQLPVGD